MQGHRITSGFTRRSDAARQLGDLVRSDILAGRLAGALPLEFELIRRYGGTRNAIRDALSILRDQGFLSRVLGSGTFVVAEGVMFSMTRSQPHIKVVGDDVAGQGPRDSYTLLGVQFKDAPESVARNLRIEPGTEVAYVENLIVFGGTPLRMRSSWIPVEGCAPLFDGRSLAGFTPDLISEALGVAVHTERALIEAINADPFTAEILSTRPDAALLVFERIMALPDGTAVEYGFSHHRGDRSILNSGMQS